MGYLNNSTRILDAILTKKGRELLSSGGNFEVTQFALGDDEIDYSLWDASHTQGTDYYGAVIENLPALEPFNDPSEIMKYKLVSRSDNTQAMAKLLAGAEDQQGTHGAPNAEDSTGAGANTGLHGVRFVDVDNANNWHQAQDLNGNPITILGSFANFGVQHLDNSGAHDVPDYPDYVGEAYTVTLLDTSVAILAPRAVTVDGSDYDIVASDSIENQNLWLPFVTSPQRLSQTWSSVLVNAGEFQSLSVYARRISANSSPAKTSIIITGNESGAVFEFDVTVSYFSS